MQIFKSLQQRSAVCDDYLIVEELFAGTLLFDDFGQSFGDVFHDKVKICALGVAMSTFGSSIKKDLCNLTIF